MKTKILIAAIILLVLIALRFTTLGSLISLDNLMEQRDNLKSFSQENLTQTIVLFIIIYIIAVALSIPGAAVLTLTSGFLFGAIGGTLIANIGATIGAIIVFFFARYFLGSWVQKKYRKQLKKFNKEFDENGTNYLLTLRLIVIFPFFLVNLFAGLTKAKFSTYAWTTSLGILPGSFVYAYAGKQLGGITSMSDIFSTGILVAFLLLALLSLTPVIYNKWRKHHA